MKYLSIVLLFFVISSNAQNERDLNASQKQIDKIYETKRQIDSSRAKMNESIAKSIAESKRVSDSINNELFQKQNERSLNALMEMQRVNEKKAKQRMWLRLGFGIAMLALGVFAMLRRRKK